ncbi:lysyl oxidase family protein [Actinoplanes sp. NPDC051346]|uniref:lysyl oxidase family protein n=1 Tax=Actinoplanes sp. NPDC051346 TaxID=3155048 RepID=UPI0034197B27
MISRTTARRRARVLRLGSAVTVVALACAGFPAAAADTVTAEPSLAPLSVVAASKDVTVQRVVYGDYRYLDFDLGVRVVAGADPLEIHANRTSYRDPIVARQVVVRDGVRSMVELPAGMVRDFMGIRHFTTVTIKNAAGKTVRDYTTDFCPNQWDSARTRRDAPATTPYPVTCQYQSSEGGNPFLLGTVWGIQAGWDALTDSLPRKRSDREKFDLAPGRYTAAVTINPALREFLHIPAEQSTTNLNVTVVNVNPDAAQPSRLATQTQTNLQATAATHAHHTAQATTSLAATSPGLRAAAHRPATVAAAPDGPRPDLRALPAWGISLAQQKAGENTKSNGRWYINFAATVWNGGTSPLRVDGFRRTGSELMDAYQYFFDAKGNEVGSAPAGTMQWDPRQGHHHWHFTDFAQYRLLTADKKVAVRSGKEAFCLVNTDAVDLTLPSALWRPENTSLGTACGQKSSVAVRQVLDIGGGDTYSQDRPGQSFDVTKLPNGTYYIEVLANPQHTLTELDTTNNSSLRKVFLRGTAKNRKLTVVPMWSIKG